MTTLPAHPLSHLTDADALRRYARRGDPRAFELLADRYRGMVLATCRRALGNDADAEDAAQETFLKLARSASTIRSNAAAWLHAAALRTSIDLLRRSGTQRRAERQAAAPSTLAAARTAASAHAAEWTDLEPILDAALDALDPADRDLIVARFLAVRPQTELAAEAGVSPGTMHRRIERALDRLRARLAAAGLSIAATSVLAATLSQAAAPSTAALQSAVAKVGLAGMTNAAGASAGGGILSKALPIAGAAILLGGTAVGVAVMRSGGGPGLNGLHGGLHQSFAVASAGAGTGAALPATRPSRPTKPLDLVTPGTNDMRQGGMVCDGKSLVFAIDYDANTGRAYTMRMTILASDPDADPVTMRLRVDQVDAPPYKNGFEEMLGREFEATRSFDELGRLLIVAQIPGPDGPREQRWLGVRPTPAHKEFSQIPTDTGPLGINGPWFEHLYQTLVLRREDITIEFSGWAKETFRILSWETQDDHARVQTICTDSWRPGLVGKRVKFLVRPDAAGGYTLVRHEDGSAKLNDWPDTFEPTPRDRLLLTSWRAGEP